MKTNAAILLLSALLFSHSAAGSNANTSWEVDIDKARQRAKKENKSLLVVFQGPDSNKICKQVNSEILPGAEFRAALSKEFVFFRALDPADAKRDEIQKAAYDRLLTEFRVYSYPILFLATSESKIYGRIRLSETDVKKLLKQIQEQKPKKGHLERAFKLAAGSGSAKELSKSLEQLGTPLAIRYYPELVNRVIELDPDNAEGLREQWVNERYRVETLGKFNRIYTAVAAKLWSSKTPEESIAIFDGLIEKHKQDTALHQQFEFHKYRTWIKAKNFPKAIESLEKAHAIAPDTPFAAKLAERLPLVKKYIRETEAKVAETPEPDAPNPDAPNPDAPEPDAPKPDAPEPEAPEPEAETNETTTVGKGARGDAFSQRTVSGESRKAVALKKPVKRKAISPNPQWDEQFCKIEELTTEATAGAHQW